MLVKQNLQAQLEARPDEDTLLNHTKSWSYDFYTNLIHWHACNFRLLPFAKSYYKPLSITITSRHWYHLSDGVSWVFPVHFDGAILQWSEDCRSEDKFRRCDAATVVIRFEPKQVWDGRRGRCCTLCNCYLEDPNVITVCWMFFRSRFNMHHFYI